MLEDFLINNKRATVPVRLTMGCTAGSLTACRLRTYVMTNYISYTKPDFINPFFLLEDSVQPFEAYVSIIIYF